MPSRRSYRLTATTALDDKGLCDFFERFKVGRINIQKLVLVQSGQRLRELELLFVVPGEPHPFLDELEALLGEADWLNSHLLPE